MDIISKRGVLMLSFARKADGTFREDQKVMMRKLGAWLKIGGEGVYHSEYDQDNWKDECGCFELPPKRKKKLRKKSRKPKRKGD